MKYRVDWAPRAEQLLAAVWLAAQNRGAVTVAAAELDAELAATPLRFGTPIDSSIHRVGSIDGLGVEFEVIEDDKRVIVPWRLLCRLAQFPAGDPGMWLSFCSNFVTIVAPLVVSAPIPADAVPLEAIKAVKAALPKGWTATAKGVTLTIRRDKKIGLFNAINAPPRTNNKPPAPQVVEPYEITLKFRPRLDAVMYEKMRKENAEIEAKLEAMRKGLRDAQITHKFDDWLPSTEEQKKLVAKYRAAQKAMPFHRLPDFYTETNSIDVEDSVGSFLSFTDEEEAKECNKVKESIGKLFKPYAWQ